MGSAPLSGELQIVFIVSGLVLLAWAFYFVVNRWRRGSADNHATESVGLVMGPREPPASELPTVEERNDAEQSVRRMIGPAEPVASVPLTGVMEVEKVKVRIPRRVINAKDMVRDIRSGMNDARLMEEYHLSSKGLQRVITKLVEAKAVTPEELFDRVPMLAAEDSVGAASVRLLPRDFLEVRVPIRDLMNPQDLGTLRNISEKGIGVRGIQARTGETKTLMVLADELFPVEPCKLEAVCRWVKRSRAEGIIDAGFEITDISEEGMQQLHKIIHWLSFRG